MTFFFIINTFFKVCVCAHVCVLKLDHVCNGNYYEKLMFDILFDFGRKCHFCLILNMESTMHKIYHDPANPGGLGSIYKRCKAVRDSTGVARGM